MGAGRPAAPRALDVSLSSGGARTAAARGAHSTAPASAQPTASTSAPSAADADPVAGDGGRFARLVADRAAGRRGSVRAARQRERELQSSWTAKEAGGGRGGGADYLYELGMSDYNTNVNAGQNVANIDYLFTGQTLGHQSDIADGSLRGWDFRTFNNIVGDYYVAPRFLEAVALHIVKNYLYDMGSIPHSCKVPLILGIWGPKGCGKSFQTELAFKQLGLEPVVMSAGELESEVAGYPGRLIRERYRKASEMSKVRGKLSCLVINDIDAGVGRFDNTQVTVNNQIVQGTLMNLCDNPNRVQVHEGWRGDDVIRRTPIILTGNDLSTVYAPLVRDGRMTKFLWQPTPSELVDIVLQMYRDDGLARAEVAALVGRFRHQPLDFFGAVRASTYDAQIREWLAGVMGADLSDAGKAAVADLHRRLVRGEKGVDVPDFQPVRARLEVLIAEGERLEAEQDAVNRQRLSEEYMRGAQRKGPRRPSLLGLKG